MNDVHNGAESASPPVVVIVGADKATIDRALLLRLNVFLIQTPDRNVPIEHANVVGSLVLDYKTQPREFFVQFAKQLAQRYHITCAVSLTEFGCLPAAWINEALGTPGVSTRGVSLTRDKVEMRKATALIDPVPWASVHTSEDVISFGNAHGWPIVVKPLDGVGSIRVHRIDEPSRVPAIEWSECSYIAEKYIVGRLISVEAFSFHGDHVVFAMNEEFPIGDDGPRGCNPNVETAHQLPANLRNDDEHRIQTLVVAALSALDVNEGPSHTEILLAEDGPHLLECHTRPGGDYIPEMVQRCTGVDLLSMAIGWPTGTMERIGPISSWVRGAAIRFLTPEPGRLKSIVGVETCVDLPNVAMLHLQVKPGESIPLLGSSADRAGFVMAVHENSAKAMEVCGAVVSRIQLEVSNASTK